MGNLFYNIIWKPIEWIVYGDNNDGNTGTPRPFVMFIIGAMLLGIIGWILVVTWLHSGILVIRQVGAEQVNQDEVFHGTDYWPPR